MFLFPSYLLINSYLIPFTSAPLHHISSHWRVFHRISPQTTHVIPHTTSWMYHLSSLSHRSFVIASLDVFFCSFHFKYLVFMESFIISLDCGFYFWQVQKAECHEDLSSHVVLIDCQKHCETVLINYYSLILFVLLYLWNNRNMLTWK